MKYERDGRVAGMRETMKWNLFYLYTREQNIGKISATAIKIHDLKLFGIADWCLNFYLTHLSLLGN